MLIHTTPTDMLSDSLAQTCLQAAVRRLLQWRREHPSPCGSARSSQWSEGEDDATYTCDGDSCEFQGTLAEVCEHENRCKQMTGKLGLSTKSADKAAPAAAAAVSRIDYSLSEVDSYWKFS